MSDVACLIIGIDGWERYTAPLIAQIQEHEPTARLVVIDNASTTPYPAADYIHRTERLPYARAINRAKQIAGDSDWTVILSNDVKCIGSFAAQLATLGNVIAGPRIMQNHGFQYVEGWCVAVNRHVWEAIGGWDDRFVMSSWEDVDFSQSGMAKGFPLHWEPLPFRHLDQQQRFGLPGYNGSEAHNFALVWEKHRP